VTFHDTQPSENRWSGWTASTSAGRIARCPVHGEGPQDSATGRPKATNLAQFGNTMKPVEYGRRARTRAFSGIPYERTREALETLGRSRAHACGPQAAIYESRDRRLGDAVVCQSDTCMKVLPNVRQSAPVACTGSYIAACGPQQGVRREPAEVSSASRVRSYGYHKSARCGSRPVLNRFMVLPNCARCVAFGAAGMLSFCGPFCHELGIEQFDQRESRPSADHRLFRVAWSWKSTTA